MAPPPDVRSPELEKALEIFDGNASALAAASEVTDQTISDWRYYRYGALLQTLERVAAAANQQVKKKSERVCAVKMWRELQRKLPATKTV